MTVRIICDGCDGTCEYYPEDGKMVEFGYQTKRYYCSYTAEIIEHFNDARDALHADIAKEWKKEYAELKKDFLGHLPDGGLLPDDD